MKTPAGLDAVRGFFFGAPVPQGALTCWRRQKFEQFWLAVPELNNKFDNMPIWTTPVFEIKRGGEGDTGIPGQFEIGANKPAHIYSIYWVQL
jgi:hypothetical protein